MTTETPTQRLAEVRLGRPLREFVLARRNAGRSWRLIARELHEATGGEVDVTPETVRSWYAERVAS